MAFWTPTDGYFGAMLGRLLGRATRREPGQQDSGGGSASAAGRAITADTALRISAVWACVRLMCEAVGACKVNVWDVKEDGTRKLNTSHWVLKLLKSPNRYQTWNEFCETLIINLMLAGNSYTRKTYRNGTKGEIISLMPMMGTQTEVFVLDDGDRSYVYTEGGNKAAFAQESIWHVPLMPSNGVVGLSPLQYGARTMGIAIAAEDRVAKLAQNGFKPTGVLMIDRLLTDAQREQIRKQFKELQEGDGDTLKVLEAGMTYQQVSLSPNDAQLLQTRQFSVPDLARFYGVPSILINDTGSTTGWGTGIAEIKQGFSTLTLQPLLLKLAASMERWLLAPEERGKIEIEFDMSRFLAGTEAQRIEARGNAIKTNQMTINEARALEGRGPVSGGDKMYAQMQMIPIGSTPPTAGIIDRRRNSQNDNPQPPER